MFFVIRNVNPSHFGLFVAVSLDAEIATRGNILDGGESSAG